MRSVVRFLSYVAVLLAIWFLWPRDLDGFMLGRDGRLAVPDYSMTNARYVSVRGSRVEMESRSEEAVFDMKKEEMTASNSRFVFYNERQEPTEITAKSTRYFLKNRKVHLSQDVQSVSHDGFTMTSDSADYYLDRKFLDVPVPVHGFMKDNSIKVWGNRAESEVNDRKVRLFGDARAEFKDPRHGLTKVRGDTAELDRSEETARFAQNVKVDQAKIVATSENGIVHYSRQEKDVNYMSLTDDVKITEKSGRYTRSQVAEFFAPMDTIVLTGFPSVYDGDDAVTGDKITLYRATGVVEVTATNAAAAEGAMEKRKNTPQRNKSEDEELIP